MTDPVRTGFEELIAEQRALESKVETNLAAHDATFFNAYKRLLSLNAWRQYLLATEIEGEALGFFVEAQNDGLVSLLLARRGMWRTSLQCLRSAVENVMASLYFRDHPVELELWESDQFRIGFAELKRYFESHPRIGQKDAELAGLNVLGKQYRILSKAVHGSGVEFRMTNGVEVPVIYGDERLAVERWSANQKFVLLGLNLLLIAFFRESISGTAHSNIRSVLGYIVPAATKKRLKVDWRIHIPQS